MPEIAVITANTGKFEKERVWTEQTVSCDFHKFTDDTFPPRKAALTPRLQARIPKMFAWQLVPDYKYYIWVDSSMSVPSSDMAKWFLEKLGDYDAVFFKHPKRTTLASEAEFIKQKLQEKDYYITPRYANELIDEELAEIQADKDYTDNLLLASTIFMYRNTDTVHTLMKEWWYHTSRYHIIDQLGLPYAIYKSKCNVKILDDNYTKLEHLKHVRKTFYKNVWRNDDGVIYKSERPKSDDKYLKIT